MKFRKKPITVEAIQWRGYNLDKVRLFMNHKGETRRNMVNDFLVIATLEGNVEARKGDWIIKGIKGEFYPCKPDIFRETYDQVFEIPVEENIEI